MSITSHEDESFQDDEEEKYSTQSIRTNECLLVVTTSHIAPKVHEIFDISYYHINNS